MENPETALFLKRSMRKMDQFPMRLRALRESEGKSRLVLSQLCGLSDGAIRKYERGEAIPTVESLVSIADHFKVSTDYLLGRTNY